jgi:hypothetical protein
MVSRCAFAVVVAGLAAAPPGIPEARTFTFQSDGTTLAAVLDEFARQTGARIDRTKAEGDRTLRIDCKNAPFWEAVERVARESDHRIGFSDDGRRLMLLGGGDVTYRETPVSFDRVFRVAARRVVAASDLDVDRSYAEVLLTLNWEPGFAVFLVEPPGRSVAARDNTEQDLRVAEAGGGKLPVSGGAIDLPVRLAGVPRTAKTIKLLEGKFGVVGAARMLEFKFDKVATAAESQELKQDGVVVRLRNDFKEKSDLWTARVELEYPEAGPRLESFETSAWLVDNAAWLVSAAGKRKIECNGGYEVVAQGERKAVIIYRFTDDTAVKLGSPADWSLVVRTPSPLFAGEVKFRLENIPLP